MELNFVLSVLDRDRAEDMASLYEEQGIPMVLTFMAKGTATSEHLDLYGLEPTEKAVVAGSQRQAQTIYRHPRQRHHDGRTCKKHRRRTHLGLSD